MSVLQTRGQEIASYAAKCVAEIKVKAQKQAEEKAKKPEKGEGEQTLSRDRYGSLARKLPSLILANGLGQTLAFLKSKGFKNDQPIEAKEHYWLYQHVSDYLKFRFGGIEGDLLKEGIMKLRSPAYRHYTSEVLAFAAWLKRFAEAELGEEG